MSLNYLRAYEIQVGTPPTYIYVDPTTTTFVDIDSELGINSFIPNKASNFMAIEGGDGISITENQISATVRGSSETGGGSQKQCVISIENLSEETIDKLTRQNLKIIFKAGYKDDADKDNLPVVFSGQIQSSRRIRKGSKNSVELICKDGYTPTSAIKVSKTLKSSPSKIITAQDIFDYLFSVWQENGIQVTSSSIRFDDLPTQPSDLFYRGGWVGDGYLRDLMDEICDSFRYQWYIVNGTLYVQSELTSTVREAISINMSTITNIKDKEQDIKRDSNEQERLRTTFTTLLDGRITESKVLVVSTTEVSPQSKERYIGNYKVVSVKHKLDYRGNNWFTEAECERI